MPDSTYSGPSTPSDAPDLPSIAAREAAATPGPWEFNGGDYEDRTQLYATSESDADEYDADILSAEECAELLISPANATFIAHARQDIPTLLAALADATAETERMKAACHHASQTMEGEGLLRCELCGAVERDPFWRNPA